MIGLGDILFFFAITPLFKLRTFILFFIIGMISSLLLHLLANKFKKQENVPLAGYLSILLISYVVIDFGLNANLEFLCF
jgi:multisubunit Na+/H+ antiporter MnhE subunit